MKKPVFLIGNCSIILFLAVLLLGSQNVLADQSAKYRMIDSQQTENYDVKKQRTSTGKQQIIRLVLDTGTVGYTCGPVTCVCSGDDDCNNMFTSACSADTSGDVCVGDSCQCNAN